MDFYLKNNLVITEPTGELLEWCKSHLTFANPEYAKKEAMGLYVGKMQKEIVLYQKVGNKLFLPFGVAKDIYKDFYKDFENVVNKIKPIRQRFYKSRINMYDYQKNAVERLKSAKNGVLVAPCGSGKTQMGLELVARIGGKALWITHTSDLLNQSYERAKACFDLPVSQYGKITEGKVNIGNTLTFATVQTLANIDLTDLRDEWDTIIIDECHRAVSTPTKLTQFGRVIGQLSARYKIGLTATPYRADKLERCMFALIGNVEYEISKREVADKTCDIKVQTIFTGYQPDTRVCLAGDGTLVYSSLINDLTHNKARNEIISKVANNTKGATLILSDRVEHCEELLKMIKGKRAIHLTATNTKASKELRKQALERLNNGEIDIVLATVKLAREGLDCPNLRYVILATPLKDKATVIQCCGRVGRIAEGKEYGVVVDLIDAFGMLQGHYKKRLGYYKSLGYEML